MGIHERLPASSLGDALFGVTRQAALALFFGHPGERFYQQQIIRTLGLGSGAVQRELDRLTRAGILTRVVEGRQTYFHANRECPIFGDLRGLVRKTFGVVRTLREALIPVEEHIEIAFVFGSIASGTETEASDLDLMVIGRASLMDVVSAMSETQRELGREVNPNVYPVDEFCRKLNAGQHFVTRVAAGPKLFLIGDERQLKGMAQIRVAQGALDKPGRNRRSPRHS